MLIIGLGLIALGFALAYAAGADTTDRKSRAHADALVDSASRGRHPSRLGARP